MRYIVEVLDSSKTKVAELSGLTAARLREKINGIATLTVETVERSEWTHVAPGTGFFRLVTSEGLRCGTFRVMGIRKARSRERAALTVTARSIIADTARELFADAVSCVNFTPAQLIDRVLGHSAFSAGTVEPSAVIPFVRFEYEPVMDCLLRVCSLTGGELSLDEDADEIDLLSAVGIDNGVAFRYGLNLRGASRTIDLGHLANRVYGVGGGDPPLGLSGAADAGGLDYVEDAASIAASGTWEGVCHEPNLEDVTNLVDTPALDGVYTGGLCQDWTATVSPTLSENTDPAKCLYGRKSQRVQTTSHGYGIEQAVTVAAGGVYSFSATMFITSGTIRAQVADGTTVYKRESPVTGTGMVTVNVENWKAINSTVTVKIFQDGTGSSDFTVDSVQIAAGASVRPFTVGATADTLYDRAAAMLAVRKDPEITYDVDLVDLYGDTRAGREADRFGLGDTVAVIDPTLDLDVETRVMERETDLLRPWRVKVRLDNPARTLADTFEAIRAAREDGIKRQRALFAVSSRAAETGSTRLGFSNRSFRFYGTVTVTGWNTLLWSAGTFRVGDAWYAISAGSTSGLGANITYYYYFNRTAPGTFAVTSSTSQSESEDRIFIFAVTTTVSPTPCIVHPMGIIHV